MRLKTAGIITLLQIVLYVANPSDAWPHSWHNGPINCYICTSPEQCSASTGQLQKCENNDAQSCVAVFDSTGAVIQRGCSDSLEATCSAQDADCYECRSHGCNNLKDNKQLIECVLCDAQDDENCVFDIELVTERRTCNEKCITALYPRTGDKDSPLELVRTCLDDLDLDDREECAAGLFANCVACDSASCNQAELGVRSSCNACTGGNCDRPESKTCRAVVPSGAEQCFIQLDENNKIDEYGCFSQYNVSDAAALQREKRIWTCSGENCNVLSALPTPQSCKLCSSRTDKNCAVDPSNLLAETLCSHPLNTDCYALLRDDGHTERGCLASLDEDDYLECLGGSNATKCSTCNGDNCNVQLQPADRLTCHICDSSVDSSCEKSPNAAELCVLHSPDQSCVTTLDEQGNTLRGCGGELDCLSSDSASCQRCTGNNCNTANLARRADGRPGLWGQELPLSCLSCSDAASCASSSLESTVCASKSEYCITVFDASGAVSARGCSDVVEASFSSYCDANSENCHNCNSNGCNSATSLDSYTECVYCEAGQNADCVTNPTAVTARRQCNGQCMSAYRPQNSLGVYELVRGCLDDKEPEDQQLCASGGDKECVACTGNACNTNDLSQSSLSCYACNEDLDCQDPVMAVCLNYSPTDRCYMLFDETASVAALGCQSDLDDKFIDDNLEKLIFCEGNNCNFFDIVPRPNDCAVCSSFDDVNCAVDPTQITRFETCNVLPNTRCMTRVLTDGSTERGCLSNLATAALRACLKGEGNCDVCEGDLCNQEIYPADRRRCQRCNTVLDPTCGSAPNAASVCPRYDESQGCSVKLVNGETYRGCQSEFECDDSDKQYCRNCKGDNCNVADLELINIGYPGKWVTPPINCYTCAGVDCQGSGLGALQKCHDNNQQNCATVFASNGSVVLRSCTDQLYGDTDLTQYCDANSGNCKFCKSSGCNNAQQLADYVDCVLCDGSEQAECVRSIGDVKRQVSCQGSCFTGLYPRNRTELDSPLELARGCLDDLEYDDRLACAEGSLEHCVSCSGAACNKEAVPEIRLSCNYCDDENCETVSPHICTAYRANDECYIHVGDRRIESMGCASDLQRSFLQANRRDLYLCSDDNCNVKDVLNLDGVICNVCNSGTYPNCILGQSVLAALCEHYLNPECYTHITEDGVLRRGCLMDTADDLYDDCLSGNSSTCQVCDSHYCNNEVFPPDWQSCLRCDSRDDADCESKPEAYAGYCPIYEADDGCVTSLEDGRTRRGCKSEIYCDPGQVASCRICEDANCNAVDLGSSYVGEPGKWQDLPLDCLVCSDLESCASVSTPTTCQGDNKQLCSTVFNADGQVIARGCSNAIFTEHLDYCEANSGKCPQCKSNGCNNAKSLDDYVDCYQCDAEQEPSCAWETPKKTRQCQGQCMTGMYPRSSAADSALLPTRGCLDDLELADREQCAAGNHANCTACTGALCNTGDIIETPHECYKCLDPECEDMEKARCVAYRPNDQCYLAFDSMSIVGMGCVSDFETQVVHELVAQQRLLICDGLNCNHPDIIPNPNSCLQCNSLTEPRCATNPNKLLTTSICSMIPYTQCVTRIDAAGRTSRGCVSNLDSDDFYGCIMGTSDNCELCTGTNCNGLSVFPVNRLRCHQCDSASDASCASAPSSSAVCPIYEAEDTCVTTLLNEVTYRGCSSSLSCSDPSNPSTCRVCSSDNDCNTINLERLNVHGSPGTWQEPPISCLSCGSASECAAGGGQLTQCVGKDNCVTVFDSTGDVVTARGCSSALDATSADYCDEQPDNCPRCNSNGCNVANTLKDYVECLVCDSSVNPNCVQDVATITRTRSCHQRCVSAFLPLFDEAENPSYALLRNCFDDIEEADRQTCGTDANKFCASCADDKCNTADLVATRHSCLQCRDDDCQDAQPAVCSNYREIDECYIEFDEQRSVVAQGCLSELSLGDIYVLQLSKRLIRCADNNCNSIESLAEPQTCVLCSSRTDRNCAVNPSNVNSATSCQLTGLPECYTRVLDDGATERGCLSSLEADEFLGCYNGTAAGCASCSGDLCNKELYPADRTLCHICNSEANANCESAPDSLSVCPVYAEGDSCVTNLRAGITYRGCATELSCEPNSKTCVICQGNGCNVADLSAQTDDNHGWWQDLPLTCLSCEGAACQQESSSLSTERCADNNEQDCITVFDASNVVIRRGCEDTIDADEQLASYCSSNRAQCPLCKSNECNNATEITQYNSCIYCDSTKSKSCLWEPTSTAHRRRQCQGRCMSALFGSTEAGLDLVRTCLDDKEPADQLICASGNDEHCVACAGEDCNVQAVPADRLSCYHCEGASCEEPTSRQCDIYKQDDSCFLWFDDTNSVQQSGCLSSFRNQDLESVIKTKRISVCQGDNCNVLTNIRHVLCAVCDSRVDPTCATTPLAIESFQTCSQLPHTHCVTRLENDGATTRGCLYDLDQTQFADCLLGNSENCTVCALDGCNREIFPANRLQCYGCSSADDSSCTSDPDQTAVCPWVSDTETCQTKLENGVTTRGCSSAIGCSSSDYRTCRSCSGNQCNSIDLLNRVDDGQHGLFQALPLKCHACEGEHCHSSLGPAVQCSLNIEQDCKTVFELDGVTVRRRGCADDVDDYEDRYCRRNPELCVSCKSNECNVAWSTAELTSCIYCNSTTNAQCVSYPQSTELSTRQCQGNCLVALVQTTVIRSCLDDKEPFDRPVCSDDGSGTTCAACAGDNCNTFPYPADRLSCHVCSNSDCTASHAEYCTAYVANDFCFAKYKDGNVELLGCASTQRSSDLDEWRSANQLYECTTKDCNVLSGLPSSSICVACDSSKTPNCAQAPTEVTTTATCHAPLTDCLTRLQEGHTVRGCLNSLSSSEGSACVANGTCVGCAGDKCNADIFPDGRLRCHICNSVANEDCSEDPNHLAICPIYAADDTCVSSRDPEGYIQRGCRTQVECDVNDSENCIQCSEIGCNTNKFNGATALGGIGLALTLAWSLVVSYSGN
ncbi:PREDICTED: uncharacterized protein LOC108617050 [Drosophila arizonae]|uniref:Uncharacterized protein LOC108617050 n=1 Tax=Drosophila arizonae TaxID=7263 RepID=A0ABM1PLU4_DROAR|nr:PREDICTED: uncharacterized protein LOC108617050 [Drosophila arizonae]